MLLVLADQLHRADHFLAKSCANLNTQRVINKDTYAGFTVCWEAGDTGATISIANTDRAKIQRVTKPKSEILMRPEFEDMSDSK